MLIAVLAVAACISVFVAAVTGAYRNRTVQNVSGFLGHTAVSAVMLAVGLSIVLAPEFWHWLYDRLVDAYLFVAGGGQ